MGGREVSASQRMTWKPNLVSHLIPYMESAGKKNTPSENNILHTSKLAQEVKWKPTHKTWENKICDLNTAWDANYQQFPPAFLSFFLISQLNEREIFSF